MQVKYSSITKLNLAGKKKIVKREKKKFHPILSSSPPTAFTNFSFFVFSANV